MKTLINIFPSTVSDRLLFVLTILAYALLIFDMSSCKKSELTEVVDNSDNNVREYKIQVNDINGVSQPNAIVKLYNSEENLLDDTLAFLSLTTAADGIAVTEESLPTKLYCKAEKGSRTSEFLDWYFHPVEIGNSLVYQVTIAQPNNTQLVCGHGSKSWLMTEYTINGVSQGYEVISILNSDSTWTDSNDRSGMWYFLNGETQIFYDYDGSGLEVTFDVLELTQDYVSFSSNQWGMQIEMEMTAID